MSISQLRGAFVQEEIPVWAIWLNRCGSEAGTAVRSFYFHPKDSRTDEIRASVG